MREGLWRWFANMRAKDLNNKMKKKLQEIMLRKMNNYNENYLNARLKKAWQKYKDYVYWTKTKEKLLNGLARS